MTMQGSQVSIVLEKSIKDSKCSAKLFTYNQPVGTARLYREIQATEGNTNRFIFVLTLGYFLVRMISFFSQENCDILSGVSLKTLHRVEYEIYLHFC